MKFFDVREIGDKVVIHVDDEKINDDSFRKFINETTALLLLDKDLACKYDDRDDVVVCFAYPGEWSPRLASSIRNKLSLWEYELERFINSK